MEIGGISESVLKTVEVADKKLITIRDIDKIPSEYKGMSSDMVEELYRSHVNRVSNQDEVLGVVKAIEDRCSKNNRFFNEEYAGLSQMEKDRVPIIQKRSNWGISNLVE